MKIETPKHKHFRRRKRERGWRARRALTEGVGVGYADRKVSHMRDQRRSGNTLNIARIPRRGLLFGQDLEGLACLINVTHTTREED